MVESKIGELDGRELYQFHMPGYAGTMDNSTQFRRTRPKKREKFSLRGYVDFVGVPGTPVQTRRGVLPSF